MNPYYLGLYEKAMPNFLDIKEKLNVVKETSFDFMEISIDESSKKLSRLKWSKAKRREIVKAMNQTDTKIMTMCLSAHRKFPLGSENKKAQSISMEIMKDAIELAVDLGIRIIQLAGYDEYYNDRNEKTKAIFFENLKKCTQLAASKSVMLAFETMETDFMNTVKKAVDCIRKVDSPYLQVYPDLGNITNAALKNDECVIDDLIYAKGHLAAMHLKETRPGEFREIPFGEGHVDFIKGIKAASDLGARMFVAEFWYKGEQNWIENIQFARKFMGSRLDEVFIKEMSK